MSLQHIIESAVNIEINRTQLVAQSLSRSGRLLTSSRNWANPFRLTVSPRPLWTWQEYRSILETVINQDRYNSSYIYLYNQLTAGTDLDWIAAYQGNIDANSNGNLDDTLGNATTQATGTSIYATYSGSVNTGYMVRNGDWIRFNNNPYAYIVTADVALTGAGNYTIPIHRGFIPEIDYAGNFSIGQKYIITTVGTTNFTLIGAANNNIGTAFTATGVGTGTGTATYDTRGSVIRVGRQAARILVQISKIPQIRYTYKDLVELTGDFELIEVIL